MLKRRKSSTLPRKLTDYYALSDLTSGQDGAGGGRDMTERLSSSHINQSLTLTPELHRSSDIQGECSPPNSPTTSSPAKTRLRTDEPQQTQPVTAACLFTLPPPQKSSVLDAFPASDQPLSENTMKNMLLSLRQTLYTDLSTAVSSLSLTVNQHDQAITQMDAKMGDLFSAHNDLVDGFADHEDELQIINLKLADLEDRSRRNNIKFRNIPESIQQSDLVQFLQSLMRALSPDLSARDMEIDRAHRLPKPSHLPASTPRDVLARIHFFTVKEKVMHAAKRTARLPDPFANIALYADLSKATMENRRQLSTITKALQNHKIPYKWGFPTKLLITHQNKTHVVRTLSMGLTLLRNWHIIPEEWPCPSDHPPIHMETGGDAPNP